MGTWRTAQYLLEVAKEICRQLVASITRLFLAVKKILEEKRTRIGTFPSGSNDIKEPGVVSTQKVQISKAGK